MAYVTLAEVEAVLGLPSGNPDEALLTELIKRAQDIIEADPPLGTGRKFEAGADATRYFDADADVEGPELWLDEDLCSITSITNGDGVVVTSDQYVTDRDTPYSIIKLLASSNVEWEPKDNGDTENAIAIVGKWAYSATVPERIKYATLRLVEWMYRLKDNQSGERDRPIVTPDGTILMPGRLPTDVELILASFRKVVVR